MATQNLGRVGLVLKGEWDSTTDYTALDVVSHDGNAWAAIQNNTNVEPTTGNSDFWQLFSNNADLVATVQGLKEDAANSAAAAAASAADAEASAQYGEDALNAIAHTFDPTMDYAAGKYVWYNGELYRFNAAHPAGLWIGTDAARYTATDEFPLIQQALDTKADAAEVADLKSAFDSTLTPIVFQPSLVAAQYIGPSDGIKHGGNKCCRTNLQTGYGKISAVILESEIYVFRLFFYDASGDVTDGTGYIGCSGYSAGKQYVPEYAAKFGITFRRADQADMQADERTNILAALSAYAPTDTTLTISGKAADAKTVGDRLVIAETAIDALEESVMDEQEIEISLSTGYRYPPSSAGNPASPSENTNSVYTPSAIDVSKYIGGTITIKRSGNPASNARSLGFVDEDNKWVDVYAQRDLSYSLDGNEYVITLPIATGKFLYSDVNTVTSSFVVEKAKRNDTAYISPTGNDSNLGTKASPFATISKALKEGYTNIRLYGGVYEQHIALPDHGEITIAPVSISSIPKFIAPERITINAATVYSGNIFVADATAAILGTTPIIFQDGYSDAETAILPAERMPQQRGKANRCDDTRLYKCAADNLSAALAEMESATEYKFYFDSTNAKLYFTAPSNDFTTYPICASADSELFSGLSRAITIKAYGIECKYMRFNISKTVGSVIANCKCSCAYASALGQFVFDDAINPRFVNCEAAMSHGASNGDGFNAHATNSGGDTFAHQSGTILENCWAHDNSDDGYSEHARGESFIIGGLYEYNGKAGVTPAYGTHCTCIGVVSRNNYSGFLLTGAADDNGIGGQMMCIDCIAKENNRNGSNNTGYGFGCIAGSASKPNTITCVNCNSFDNASSNYRAGRTDTDTNTYMLLINCRQSGGYSNHGYGNVEIKNGTLVES